MPRASAAAIPPPVPDEPGRLAALRRYRILDTAAEISFDDVAELTAALSDSPVALVSLVDEGRAWFKARVGLDVPAAPRDIAFCSWAVADPSTLLQVPDLQQDERFATNPLVADAAGFRAYTKVPLVTDDGHALGTLCVLDRQPKQLNPQQLQALSRLARTVMSHIEARRVAHALLSPTQVLDEVRGLNQLTTLALVAARSTDLLLQVAEADSADLLLAQPDGSWCAPTGDIIEISLGQDALRRLRDGDTVLAQLHALRAADSTTPLGRRVASCPAGQHGGQDGGVGRGSALHLPLLRDGVLHGTLTVRWQEPVTAADDTLLRVLEVVAHETCYAVTELRTHNVLCSEAHTDALTGLMNRRRADTLLQHWPQLTLALVDLDHFKRVNDQLGHGAGDDVLRRFAVALARRVRAGDVVARWGGEEFLIALPDHDSAVLTDLLQRVRDDLAGAHDVPFSAGIASRAGTETLAAVLSKADAALYAAKNAGRGRAIDGPRTTGRSPCNRRAPLAHQHRARPRPT